MLESINISEDLKMSLLNMNKLYLASPTTGLVDIHYMRSVFLLQAECHKRKVGITYTYIKVLL